MEKTMVGLWEHSLSTAVVARGIAIKQELNDPEEVMVSALLHDIGKVAMKAKFFTKYGEALSMAEGEGMLIKDAEEKIFAINHADAGGWLCQKWNFPTNLVEPVAYHHKPSLAKHALHQAEIVHVADILVRARGFGFPGDRLIPAVSPEVWEKLLLSESDVRDLLSDMENAIQEAADLVV